MSYAVIGHTVDGGVWAYGPYKEKDEAVQKMVALATNEFLEQYKEQMKLWEEGEGYRTYPEDDLEYDKPELREVDPNDLKDDYIPISNEYHLNVVQIHDT